MDLAIVVFACIGVVTVAGLALFGLAVSIR